MTRGEIAKGLDLKKTSWLNGIIECLVTDGYLVRHEGTHTNGVGMFWYEVQR
jgi:hypothetical protein